MYILLTFISVFDAGFISFESRVVSNKLIHGGDHGGSCQVPCLRPRLYFTQYTCICVHAYVYIYTVYIHMHECIHLHVIYIYSIHMHMCIHMHLCIYQHGKIMGISTSNEIYHVHLQWDISWGTIYVVKIIASSTIPLYIPWPKGINRELSCSFNGIINNWQTIMTKMTLLGGIVKQAADGKIIGKSTIEWDS